MSRILLVLDQPDVLLLLRRELRLGGHQVALAADADDARARLGEAGFDLVVIDMAMPVGDGRQMAAALERSPSPGGPRILALGAGQHQDAGGGSRGSLPRPATVAELTRAVLAVLEADPGG